MKKTEVNRSPENEANEMRSEYQFDYRKAHPNRFAGRKKQNRLVVVLDPDITQVFTTPEAVNNVLRALITTMPSLKKREASLS